jgi:glutamate/tyrosine decarboxylase-like PLP-dependent enzyme
MDNNSLDYSVEDFLKILAKTNEIVTEQYKNSIYQKGFHNISQKELEDWFDEPLPLSGIDSLQLLSEVKEKIVDTATGNLGENMYAYVMAGGNQISTIADFIASTINQNVTKWHLAPAMTEVEKRVVAWTAEMINYAPEAGGTLVSGGSAANLAGLTVARNIFFKNLNINKTGLFAKQPFRVYCSKETHNSIDKSVALLGIGTDNLMRIDTNPDYTININALEAQIKDDLQNGFVPFCIVGNAGTVNTGAIDDLTALVRLATKYKTWFHVDGCYGGLASSLPHLKPTYAGIEQADSVALDFHKWLYQPFEIGCVLVKNWRILRETYFKQADYLDTAFEDKSDRLEFNEHYFQLSRNAKALKVWMSVKAYGFTKIQKMIQKDIDLTHYLVELINKSEDFELKSVSDLAIACFVFRGNLDSAEKIVELNQRLIPALESDGRVFITGTKLNGEFVLRACLINHRKQESSINYLLETIRDVGTKIIENQSNAHG